MSRIVPIHDEHEEVVNLNKDDDDEIAEEQDWVYVPFTLRHFVHRLTHIPRSPTCSFAVRRQWQAIRLFFGLKAFRAQRTIRRKVGL